jgi:hypothetical protein
MAEFNLLYLPVKMLVFFLSVSLGNHTTRFNNLKMYELCLVTVLFHKHSFAVLWDEGTGDESCITLLRNDSNCSRTVSIIHSIIMAFA